MLGVNGALNKPALLGKGKTDKRADQGLISYWTQEIKGNSKKWEMIYHVTLA